MKHMDHIDAKAAVALRREAQAYVMEHYDDLYDRIFGDKPDFTAQAVPAIALFDVLRMLDVHPLEQDQTAMRGATIILIGYMEFYAERSKQE